MSNRLLRVNELLQREISAYLHSRHSSETMGITITGAAVTGDLREAKIYYAALGGEEQARAAGKWLLSHRREIRGVVAKHVIIRHVPELTFVQDESGRRALRVEALLDEIGRPESKDAKA